MVMSVGKQLSSDDEKGLYSGLGYTEIAYIRTIQTSDAV